MIKRPSKEASNLKLRDFSTADYQLFVARRYPVVAR